MKDAVYKMIGINGTSSTSIEDAINGAIKREHETLRNLRWFEVMNTRGKIRAGKGKQWQVTIKVGFLPRRLILPPKLLRSC